MEINEQKFTRAELESQLDFMHLAYLEHLEDVHRLDSFDSLPPIGPAKRAVEEKVEAIRLAIQHLYPEKVEYEHSYGWAYVKQYKK